MLKGGGGGKTTPLLQHVARFDGGGEIVGFGGGNKESMPWCSLFVGFPSLGVVAVCTRISSRKYVPEREFPRWVTYSSIE